MFKCNKRGGPDHIKKLAEAKTHNKIKEKILIRLDGKLCFDN